MLAFSSATFYPRVPLYLRSKSIFMAIGTAPSFSSFSPSSSSELAPYSELIKLCNRGKEERAKFVPFRVDNVTVGFMHPSFLQHLKDFPEVFSVVTKGIDNEKERPLRDSYVTLHHDLQTQEKRTVAVNTSLKVLGENGVIPGWRNEMYPVVNAFGDEPFFSLERAAVPYFGTKAYGVHMNGFSVDFQGKMHLWVAKRSKTKQTFPGMLDNLVAGGQPVGLSCKDNIIKECDEEAGIPRELAERVRSVSAVSYEDVEGSRLKRDVLFCYDLELPYEFKPYNKDGEVEDFTLLPIEHVKKALVSYKPNCVLVVMDFLFRHGLITPDQTGYLEILASLRQGECV